MKVLAIMGSPRKGKNNDALLDSLLKGISAVDPAADIEKLYVSDLAIAPCLACDACTRRAGCTLKDGVEDLYVKYNNADLIIITSPMYFNSISGQLKAIIDRNQGIWSSKYILRESLIDKERKRAGYVIITAGAAEHPYGLSAVTPIMDLFFKSINAEYCGNHLVSNTDISPAYLDKQLLEEMLEKGKNIAKYYLGGCKAGEIM